MYVIVLGSKVLRDYEKKKFHKFEFFEKILPGFPCIFCKSEKRHGNSGKKSQTFEYFIWKFDSFHLSFRVGYLWSKTHCASRCVLKYLFKALFLIIINKVAQIYMKMKIFVFLKSDFDLALFTNILFTLQNRWLHVLKCNFVWVWHN